MVSIAIKSFAYMLARAWIEFFIPLTIKYTLESRTSHSSGYIWRDKMYQSKYLEEGIQARAHKTKLLQCALFMHRLSSVLAYASGWLGVGGGILYLIWKRAPALHRTEFNQSKRFVFYMIKLHWKENINYQTLSRWY